MDCGGGLGIGYRDEPGASPTAFAGALRTAFAQARDHLRKLEAANERMPLEASPATAHLFIVNPLSAQGFARLFSTHPPIDERIHRLERMASGQTAVG